MTNICKSKKISHFKNPKSIILEIKYKEKPVWNNNQNQVIPTQEKIQQKKFRIATKMPYELDFRASNIRVKKK